jgi:hypothetical protein
MRRFASVAAQHPSVPPRSLFFSTIAQYMGDQMNADELIGLRRVVGQE